VKIFFNNAESELPEGTNKFAYINAEIARISDFYNNVTFEGLKTYYLGGTPEVSVYPFNSEGYNVAVVVVEKLKTNPDDEIILVSNEQVFSAVLEFERKSDDNGRYSCPVEMKDIPEIAQMYNDYNELDDPSCILGYNASKVITLSSFYCDRKTRTIIPHEGKITLYQYGRDGDYGESVVKGEKTIHIDLPDAGNYELISVSEEQFYPHISIPEIYGARPSVIENTERKFNRSFNGNGKIGYHGIRTAYYEGNLYDYYVGSVIDLNDPQFVRFRQKAVILFYIASVLVIALLIWRRYVLNKAECYFEDYRRDLTDHLAHDIKTPLMAISGYAENIMETDADEEKKKKYLDSIIGNVEFTKKLIERTAALNSMEKGSGKLSKEKINIEETLKTLFDKYELLFSERSVEVRLTGNAEITAQRESVDTLLENLVSNAVKYTAENGTLKAEITPKKLVMTNTVKEKISTKDLKCPFVRGDKSRSNTRGTGLGLSIAESAAQLNGFRLKIKCTDKEFVSEIIF
ncbi:MAG: HAMP domain-containing histidine kinase, partial [Oscillospiraceae bacterium]|nr:HAMP domain-containing histidine kinase [Oscillospiraceae bacterium]